MTPDKKQIRRWQKYLANERAEAVVYRELARTADGEERDILLKLAEAEDRHEQYWRNKLGNDLGMPRRPSMGTRTMAFLARRFGSVFTLALMQSAESRTPYSKDADATEQMTADERIHAEVVRGLAQRGRQQVSGGFRAAVFGANDGLVSNLALVLGIFASGASNHTILLTGLSGLLAGALSMAAGEYISVASQRELLEASTPHPKANTLLPQLDVNANELALVYRARGMDAATADHKAQQTLRSIRDNQPVDALTNDSNLDAAGSPTQAALSSFIFFATGALLPIIPFILNLPTNTAAVASTVIVSVALLTTGATVGLLSGTSPMLKALRQLAIGLAAAATTYGIGSLFG